MKHPILLILLAFAPFILHSQTVDGINLAEKTEITYLEILDRQFGFKLKNHGVIINIGQNTDNFYKSGKVLSPAGTSIEFNNGIDALNHFTQWGWDLLYQPIINADSSANYVVYHYFMKRRK